MDVQIGREWMNDTREIVSSLNSYQELALWRIFSLGVGYASRLVSVESETVVDDRTVVVGKLEIWPGKTAPATLDIDSQGVVRSAEIDAGVTELIIKTEGLRQYSEDFRAATTGHFVRRYKRDLNSTAPSFRYNVESIEFELSKSKFDELADISPPPGEHVSDVSPDASRKLEPYPEVSSNGAGTFRTVMMVNGLILLLFGIALYVRRKRAV